MRCNVINFSFSFQLCLYKLLGTKVSGVEACKGNSEMYQLLAELVQMCPCMMLHILEHLPTKGDVEEC